MRFGTQVNSGSNNLLEVGEDWFLSFATTYTGYMIEFENETYAIFANRNRYWIPYNRGDGDLAPLANDGGSTTNRAVVFNCFARGTRTATS